MIGTSKNIWGFDPRSVPGCQLWLDGADSNTVTGTTSVTAWRDKSGNGYVANSFVNSVPNPSWVSNVQNGNGVIQYSAGNGSSIANFVLAQTMSIFKVYYPINQSTGSPFIEHGPDTNSSSGLYFHAQNGNNFSINSGSGQVAVNFGTTAVSNTWQMIEGINPDPANGNTMAFYVNGTTRASGLTQSGTTTITKTLYINGRGGANNLSYNTYLAELIIYNIGVTTSQRQQIEGYLAHKWGLTTPIPSTHPFKSIRPHLRTFQPTDIPGCQLWLDGADSSTITGTTTVTQWRDKSGNSRHLGVGSGTTSYSSNAIQLNSSYMFIDSLVDLSKHSMFIVAKGTGQFNKTIFNAKPLFNVSWNSLDGFGFYLYTQNLAAYFTNTVNDADVTLNANTTITQVYSCQTNETSSSGWVNGVLQTVRTLNATRTTTARGFAIGAEYYNNMQNNSGAIASIYEILVYNTALTTSQRQQIEGYLAHKWGLTTPIPSTHPFKSILPATAAHFYPTDITGCSLWLDGADSSQVTFSSSSNVNTWIDKSGFNNSSSNQSLGTTITYPGTKVNGLNTVNFTAGCIRGAFNGSSVINTTDVTIFIVTAETAPNDNLRMFSLTPAANYQDDQASNMLIYCAPGNYQLTFFRGGAMPSPYTVTQNVPFIYSLTQTSGTGSMWLNGGSNRTASITTSAFAVTNYNIGTQYLANQNYTGLMCEVVVYNTLLNTTQRQKVEGYLAHKWGLVNSLPSKHPYKPSPPIFPPNLFFPTPSMYSALFSSANNPSLTIPANAALTLGTNNHTIEFWLYQTSRNTYDVTFSYGNTSLFAQNNYFMTVGSYIGIVIGNGSGNWAINIDGGALPSLNEWHHYAFVRNGTTFTFYLNGINRGSATSSVNIPAQGDVFRIGNTTTYPINGYISNFRLVNGTAVYTSNFTPPTTPLTAIPNTQVLIQGLVDRGPNAFTVTNNGGVTLSTSVSPF